MKCVFVTGGAVFLGSHFRQCDILYPVRVSHDIIRVHIFTAINYVL